MKAKSRSTGWKGDSSSGRPRLGRPWPWATAARRGRPRRRRPARLRSAVGDDLGMQLAEMRHHPIAEPDHAGAAGMIPVRRARLGRHVVDRRADGGRARPARRPWHRRRRRCAAGPAQLRGTAMLWRMPAATVRWPAGVASLYCGPTSNSAGSAKPARLVARGGVDQVGQDRGPHRVELGGDRVQQAQIRAAAAETLGLPARQERPGDRLVHAARAERAARQRHAALQRRRAPAGRSPTGAAATSSGSCRSRRRASLPRPGRPRRRCRAATTAPRPSTDRCRSTTKPSLPRIAAVSVARHVDRRSASSRDRRARCSCAASRGMTPLDTISLASPPHSSRIRRVATSAPHRHDAGSTPRSKRLRASDWMPSLRPVAAMRDRRRNRRLRGRRRWWPR